MFTRMLEYTVKPGKLEEFKRLVREELLLALHQQHGFLDLMTLISRTEADHLIVLTCWQSPEAEAHFEREQYPAVLDKLEHLLKSGPMERTFDVDLSTAHHIAPGKAA